MALEKKIAEEIVSLHNIRALVQTYEEIAATRMQKVKNSVLNNRDFLADLYEIYQHVKYSYKKEVDKLEKQAKRKGSTYVIPRNGKTVSVLLSANTGLYGDIIRKTFEKFAGGISGIETDVVIVGKLGKGFVEANKDNLKLTFYKYFELSDNVTDTTDFSSIIEYIVAYEKVIVYHGQFESILSQIAVADSLSGDLPSEDISTEEGARYIFEPSLDKIISFFESEIMASIFEQTMHESSLSKYASRMINLDRAVVNITERLNVAKFRKQRAHHNNMNKKQLSLLSSRSLWGK